MMPLATVTTSPLRILIVRLSAFGDVVQTLPLLKELRKHHPNAHIGWLVETAAAPLLETHPDIDVLHVAHRKAWVRRLFQSPRGAWQTVTDVIRFIQDIKQQHYTVVIDTQGLFKSAIWGWLATIPMRIGFKPSREVAHWFYTHTHASFHPVNSNLHASQEFLSLLTLLNPTYSIPPATALQYGLLPLTQQALPTTLANPLPAHWLEQRTQQPIVALAPCTAWASKQWGKTQWQALATQLLGNNYRVVWIGSAADEPWITDLLTSLPAHFANNYINWVGNTTLPQLYTLFQYIDYFVGPDSVALHLANAYTQEQIEQTVKIIGLFGATKPTRTGTTIHRSNSRLLQSPTMLPCMPCHKKTCQFPVTDTVNHMACMQQLTPQQVIEAIQQLP